MNWMEAIILKHLTELNHVAPGEQEEVEYRAKSLTANINRILRARGDFKVDAPKREVRKVDAPKKEESK